jgi:hypothetical protein
LSPNNQQKEKKMKNGMIVDEEGNKRWYKNDQPHRKDGPACEYAYGFKEWFINGRHHREDGPAIEWADGSKLWFINGQLHREEGPAIEWADGNKEWYLNDVLVTEQIVLKPKTITLAQIRKSNNNEVRSIMIERYGWQRYLVDINAQVIDKRDNAIENTKEALFATGELGNRLVVTCPTGRVFTLGVPSDAKTCEEAQKWLGNASAKINVIGRT